MTKKPIALIIQRFGPDVIGGAESYAAQLAHHLHLDLGYEVHVYTTCAKSYVTWKNEYPAGEELAAFGKVLRFKNMALRAPLFGLVSRVLRLTAKILSGLHAPKQLIQFIEWLWIAAQGPVCPSLIKNLKQNQYEYQCAILMTYLYWPTLAALDALSIKKILVPLAHDEPPLYFNFVKNKMTKAQSILVNVQPEYDLVRLVAPDARISIAGAGIALPENAAQISDSMAENPYLFYLGRISRGKGIDRLISYMKMPEIRSKGFKLILAGEMDPNIEPLLNGLDAEYIGFIDEQAKANLIAGAAAVVNPSEFESLSLIVLEAMNAKRPIIVNRDCKVLKYYCDHVKTCFGFNDYFSFLRAVSQLDIESHKDDWSSKLNESHDWVRRNFLWNTVMKNFRVAIDAQ